MKVTILDLLPGEEEEIIVKCNQLSEDMMRLLARFKQGMISSSYIRTA